MVGEFWEAPVVFRPTVATPVFADIVVAIPPVGVTWSARQAFSRTEGDTDIFADVERAGVAWRVPDMPAPDLGGLDSIQSVDPAPVTWAAPEPAAAVDNGSDVVQGATRPVVTWAATTPAAQVDDISIPTTAPVVYWGAPTPARSIGDPSDPMRSGVPRRFRDLDRVHEYPKGDYVVHSGAACSRIGHGVRPLQSGEEFAGFSVEHASESDPYVAVQPVGVVELDVEGVTGPTAIGSEVLALHGNRFTVIVGSGSSIGRVVSWRRGRRCSVYFEAPAYRSL